MFFSFSFSDFVDHLFAVLPDFGLRAYQRSSDRDPQSSES